MESIVVSVLIALLISSVSGHSADEYAICATHDICVGLPQGCVSNSSCTVLFRSKPMSVNQSIAFEVLAALQPGHYASVGFSKDSKMGDDLVFDCLAVSADKADNQVSWNSGRTPLALSHPIEGVHVTELEHKDGKIHCVWRMPSNFNVTAGLILSSHSFDFLTNKYHVLLATGPFNPFLPVIGYMKQVHTSKLASVESINLSHGNPNHSRAMSNDDNHLNRHHHHSATPRISFSHLLATVVLFALVFLR